MREERKKFLETLEEMQLRLEGSLQPFVGSIMSPDLGSQIEAVVQAVQADFRARYPCDCRLSVRGHHLDHLPPRPHLGRSLEDFLDQYLRYQKARKERQGNPGRVSASLSLCLSHRRLVESEPRD